MKVGIDGSLKECWKEGMLIMEFKARKLFPNGRKKGMDEDCAAYFYRSDGCDFDFPCKEFETWVNWRALKELYEKHKEGVDAMRGFRGRTNDLDNPDEQTMVHLCSDLLQYGVIDGACPQQLS